MTDERRSWIIEKLKTLHYVSLDELKSQFPNVSEMTLRRDMDYFEKKGDAFKVKGGIRSAGITTEETDDPYTNRANENINSKIKIAKTAAKMLEVGCSIFVDSGTTVQKMVQFVPNNRFVFTTTSPLAALELCRIGLPVVNLVGGKLDRDYQAVSGMQALRYLEEMNIDTAILCPSGLSLESGFTGGNYNECELKRMIVKKARKVLMLMDSTKIGRSLPYTFCNLDEIDYLICDEELPVELQRKAAENNIKVIIAE